MSQSKSVICPVLIGRADDLAALQANLEEALQGRGAFALVSGEAGVGKSRLVSEALLEAGGRGPQVLRGNCFETDRSLPYAPLLDLIRNFIAGHAGEDLTRYFDSTATELSKILPGLAGTKSRVKTQPKLGPEQEKQRLFQALERFLIPQEKEPRIVAIEDLHWSDDTSLEFLLRFARAIRSQPILLLATYRSDEVSPALEHWLAELDRERLATEVELKRLSSMDVDAMLRVIFELDRPVRSEFMSVLYPLTEGNPFFIEEVLKSLIAAGDIYYEAGTWDRKPIRELHVPRSVQDAVRRRAERLSSAARTVLTTAAAIGQRFGFALLQDVSGQAEADLLPRLKELISAQLVVEETGERFAFRHALTRQAVYSQLLERERAPLHQRIGESIERRQAESPEERFASLAYHFYRAGNWQKALEYSRGAGDNARRLYAPRAAVEYYTQALQSAAHLSLPVPAAVSRERAAAYDRLGEFELARLDYETALQAARASEDRTEAWQSLLGLAALWAGRDYVRTGDYLRQALDVATEINRPETLASTLNRLGNWEVNIEQPTEGLLHHEQALQLFLGADNRRGSAQTYDLLGMANYIRGDLVRSETYYHQAVQLFRELDDRQGLASSLASMTLNSGRLQSGMGVLAKTNRDDARLACEESLKTSRDIGWRSGEAYALIILGNYLGIRGNYAEALASLNSALAIATDMDHLQWTVYAGYCLGALHLDLLDLPRARAHLESALQKAADISSRWWVTNITGFLAQTCLLQNDAGAAASALAAALNVPVDALEAVGEIRAATLGQRLCWMSCAQLALSRKKPQLALHIVDQLIASSANLTNEELIAPLSHLRGQILFALENLTEAEAELVAARESALAEGERPLLWRIWASLGRVYQRQSRRKEAAGAFRATQGILDEIAVTIDEDPLRKNFRKQASMWIPTPSRSTSLQDAKREFGGLTRREREVAAMVAEGKTNREIAESLVVSTRTVETHVENVLTRLGFSSRAQIAAWAVEKGLLTAQEIREIVWDQGDGKPPYVAAVILRAFHDGRLFLFRSNVGSR